MEKSRYYLVLLFKIFQFPRADFRPASSAPVAVPPAAFPFPAASGAAAVGSLPPAAQGSQISGPA
jgi:hypothetical protein